MEGSRSTHKMLQKSTDIDADAAVKLKNAKKKDGNIMEHRRPCKWQLPNSH
jgi:hypothetical protein